MFILSVIGYTQMVNPAISMTPGWIQREPPAARTHAQFAVNENGTDRARELQEFPSSRTFIID